MIKELLQVDPFPPTDVTGIAITNVGQSVIHVLIIMIFIILMLYSFRKIKDLLPMLVIYGFSLIIGVQAFEHLHTPFSPMFEVFFLVFQTVIFLMASLETYKVNRKK